jgi:hypoxanthine phosphoribosyltransferase
MKSQPYLKFWPIARVFVTARNILHPCKKFSSATFVSDVIQFSQMLPRVDVIVGIPRFGLIVAGIIAEIQGLPLSTPDHMCNMIAWNKEPFVVKKGMTALLVDDSMGSGDTMQKYKSLLESYGFVVKTAVVYKQNVGNYKVDYYLHSFTGYPMFEIERIKNYNRTCSDMDGVICEDYTGGSYRSFLSHAKLLNKPKYELQAIITARIEPYRDITEVWLKEHDIKYNHLYMRKCISEDPLWFKARTLLKELPVIYWESNPVLASRLELITGITTQCFDPENAVICGSIRQE